MSHVEPVALDLLERFQEILNDWTPKYGIPANEEARAMFEMECIATGRDPFNSVVVEAEEVTRGA